MAVLGRGHGDGTAPGGGGADHGAVGMLGGVLIGTPDVGVGALGIVTGGDGQDGVEILHAAVDGVQLGVLGAEAGAGTQGHVDDVHIQQQGVLDGGHQVILISAAVGTEDLHNDHLGIGSHADDGGTLAGVGGGDTGDVGAVVALLVIIVGSLQALVHIVEGEGDLGAAVQILRGSGRIQLRSVQLGQDLLNVGHGQAVLIQLGIGGEGGVVQVQAGIDNGDFHAGAGVAQVLPDAGDADHVGGGGGVDGLALVIDGHQEDGLDALQLGDLGELAEGDIGGDGVGQVGELITDIQLAVQHLVGDGLDQLVLPGQHFGLLVGGDSLDLQAGFGQGLLLQNDEGRDQLVGCVQLGGLLQLLHALGQLGLGQIGLDLYCLGGPFALGISRRLCLDGVLQRGDPDGFTGLLRCLGTLAGNQLILTGVQSRNAGNGHVQNQTQSQQHRNHALEIHVCSSFSFLRPRQTPVRRKSAGKSEK